MALSLQMDAVRKALCLEINKVMSHLRTLSFCLPNIVKRMSKLQNLAFESIVLIAWLFCHNLAILIDHWQDASLSDIQDKRYSVCKAREIDVWGQTCQCSKSRDLYWLIMHDFSRCEMCMIRNWTKAKNIIVYCIAKFLHLINLDIERWVWL